MSEGNQINEHWKNWIGWSSQRQEIWDSCPLAFWSRYIGRWERGEKGKALSVLANARTLRDRINTFVLDIVGTSLHHALLGRGVDRVMAVGMFNKRMEHLRNHREHIIEHINGVIGKDYPLDSEGDRGLELLDEFFETVWPALSKSTPLDHGRILSYDVDGHRVWLNIDVAIKGEGGGVTVMEILPEAFPGDETTLSHRTSSMALWAMKAHRLAYDKVKVEYVNLTSQHSMGFITPDRAEIQEFKKHVVKMCTVWEEMMTESSVEATPEVGKCRSCAFSTRCGSRAYE